MATSDSVKPAADTLQAAQAAFDAGNYREAGRALRALASSGEPEVRSKAVQLLAPLSMDRVMLVIYGVCLVVLGWASVAYLR